MIAPHKGFRTPTDFVLGASESPAPVVIDPMAPTVITTGTAAPAAAPAAGEATPAAQETAKDAAPAAAEAPAPAPAPAPAAKPPRPAKAAAGTAPVHTHKRASDEPPAPPPAPWDSESADVKGPGYQYRFDRQLHAKIQWISDNVPQHKSMQVVIDKAVRAYVEATIAQHYKPE